jgi:ABC-type transport system involved in cytochrome c biogenesis permease subunit
MNGWLAPWQAGAPPELAWLWLAVAGLLPATALACWPLRMRQRAPAWAWATEGSALPLQGSGPAARHDAGLPTWWSCLLGTVLLAAVGLGLRWARLGHGPFIDLFEILASSLCSLGALYALACLAWPGLRRTAPVVLPLLLLLGAWLLACNPADTHLPATYRTPVLWFHVLLGKLFLACALVALGLAGLLLQAARQGRAPAALQRLDTQAWQWMQVALVFESLMLIAGAVWAQDAWGRWWAWDPLETWAFITWLTLVGALHARLRGGLGPRAGAWLVVAVFALAFLTFFGVPFVSVAPHKGAV